MSERPFVHADVPPDFYGTDEWWRQCEPLLDVGAKRRPEDPAGWASDYLREVCDRQDLKALGYCRDCGQAITLRQIGSCVYSEPCGHYRTQGDLRKMAPFMARRLARITPERERALLALIENRR